MTNFGGEPIRISRRMPEHLESVRSCNAASVRPAASAIRTPPRLARKSKPIPAQSCFLASRRARSRRPFSMEKRHAQISGHPGFVKRNYLKQCHGSRRGNNSSYRTACAGRPRTTDGEELSVQLRRRPEPATTAFSFRGQTAQTRRDARQKAEHLPLLTIAERPSQSPRWYLCKTRRLSIHVTGYGHYSH
jgi:hypothetical protein